MRRFLSLSFTTFCHCLDDLEQGIGKLFVFFTLALLRIAFLIGLPILIGIIAYFGFTAATQISPHGLVALLLLFVILK
jgi:hypothetical protein